MDVFGLGGYGSDDGEDRKPSNGAESNSEDDSDASRSGQSWVEVLDQKCWRKPIIVMACSICAVLTVLKRERWKQRLN
jgi:hypothetical protein